jgi:hypothetical protein
LAKIDSNRRGNLALLWQKLFAADVEAATAMRASAMRCAKQMLLDGAPDGGEAWFRRRA